MNKIITHKTTALSIEYPYEVHLFRALVGAIALIVVLYIYFVFSSIFNIMAERVADAQSTQIQNSIATLEDSYFQVSQAITPSTQGDLGLTTMDKPAFVNRVPSLAEDHVAYTSR